MDPEDPDSDLDLSQNLIISSFYLFRHILKISSKSVHKFLGYLVHKRTNKPRQKHNLLGGGNNMLLITQVTESASSVNQWHYRDIYLRLFILVYFFTTFFL